MTNTFDSLVRYLREGGLSSDANEALEEMVSAVNRTRRKGTLTLKLTFNPPKSSDSRQITVEDVITAKPPVVPNDATVLYVNDDNELVKRNPDARDPSRFESDPSATADAPIPDGIDVTHAGPTAEARDVG